VKNCIYNYVILYRGGEKNLHVFVKNHIDATTEVKEMDFTKNVQSIQESIDYVAVFM